MDFLMINWRNEKLKIEKYIDSGGKSWVRVRYTDRYRTEVIMPEEKFEKNYGDVGRSVV